MFQAHVKLYSVMGEIHVELNLATRTVNQVITTSQRTSTITFEDANQCEISREIQRERIGMVAQTDHSTEPHDIMFVTVQYCMMYPVQ